MSEHPHSPRSTPSILSKRVFDVIWRTNYLDKDGHILWSVKRVLHGPGADNGLAEVKAASEKDCAQGMRVFGRKCTQFSLAFLGQV